MKTSVLLDGQKLFGKWQMVDAPQSPQCLSHCDLEVRGILLYGGHVGMVVAHTLEVAMGVVALFVDAMGSVRIISPSPTYSLPSISPHVRRIS